MQPYETIEELKDAIVLKASEVRSAQKMYFKFRSSNYLQNSKRLETELDRLLEELNEKITHTKEQLNLF